MGRAVCIELNGRIERTINYFDTEREAIYYKLQQEMITDVSFNYTVEPCYGASAPYYRVVGERICSAN
jgi:hypothetical protein